LGIGVGAWLFTMIVVMPLTGAGFFATGLLVTALLTNAGYLLLFLAYTTVLILGRLLVQREPIERRQLTAERRALLAGLTGTVVALVTARFVGREGGLVGSTLPLAVAPETPTSATAVPPGPTSGAQPTLA